MAQWTETQEPYVKVVRETVHTSALNPTAGEDLIVGVTFISDSGPAVPTLISSQSEFLSTYASQDVSKEYLESLNKLYEAGKTGDKTLASTMWANAYRLAGSTTMLCCRASKANDMFYAKPLQKGDGNTYILRDGALLKKMPTFKLVINARGDDADHDQDGWSICVKNVGILGNRTTDDGAQYDYMVNTLPELVDQLNETSMFFCPSCSYYSDDKATSAVDPELNPEAAIAVIFDEIYLGEDFIDTSDNRCPLGRQYVVTCQPDWTSENPNEKVIDLNDPAYSGFDAVNYYATNAYNSATDLRVRIRRFNHDAVASKQLSSVTCNETNSESPWKVLTKVLDTFTKNGTQEPSASTLERDFYEVCVQDPSVADEPQFFNIGNITGRGDMTAAEVNSLIKMVQLQLPDDMKELGLNYYDYQADDNIWTEIPADTSGTESAQEVADYNALLALEDPTIDEIRKVTDTGKYYKYVANGNAQIYVDLNIDPSESSILNVSDADLKKALDLIGLDEVYVTEGLCDLGNTSLDFQSYMANMAINENYFYPISTTNSTNYMTIGNFANKITQDSYKLYMSAPWDIDTASLGWQTYMSPSVLYWEAVSRNRRNNNEFAPLLGQSNSVMGYAQPVTEFDKKSRQLLLTRKVNTVLWNTQTNAWNMNDNYTKQSENNIMSDEANSRLGIRIAKAMPVLLRQFIGWRISPRLWASAYDVIDYWFKTSILSLNYNLDAYQIIIDETNNPVEVQRQNKMAVQLNIRFLRSLKFVTV